MKRLSFLKTLLLAPVAAVSQTIPDRSLEVESCRLFKYQTARGRPLAMFTMPAGTPAQWWNWIFEDESKWTLPPKTWRDSATCTGCPRDWGWKAFEGNAAELATGGAFIDDDFPDTTVIESWAQHQFETLRKKI